MPKLARTSLADGYASIETARTDQQVATADFEDSSLATSTHRKRCSRNAAFKKYVMCNPL
ncbi:MAG: hypothetical protein HY376_01470 [Candidatus Blackburnbacteria bacterium]|nr:hypothetical protein [Candidatus Blackburnbacteria bacterium]